MGDLGSNPHWNSVGFKSPKMIKELYFVTSNKNKVREAEEILKTPSDSRKKSQY